MRWHLEFERRAQEAHHELLRSLGLASLEPLQRVRTSPQHQAQLAAECAPPPIRGEQSLTEIASRYGLDGGLVAAWREEMLGTSPYLLPLLFDEAPDTRDPEQRGGLAGAGRVGRGA